MNPIRLAVSILAASAIASPVSGGEVVVQNDSFDEGDDFNICPCFAANEEAAVWLTSPCDGAIIGIQIFWRSVNFNTQPSIEDSIIVYEGGNFPNPGPVKDSFEAPVLTDNVLNEFRYEDENQTIPINIPVTAGEKFVVSLKFFNSNAGDPTAASIGSDDDGCQAGKNAVKVNGFLWSDACGLGVSGDWVIRAIIECDAGDPTGACCLPDGSCADGLTISECTGMGGTYQGDASDCASVSCPPPLGACCFSGGGCLELSEADCMTADGSWLGPLTPCDDCQCDGDVDGSGAVDSGDISFVIFRLGDTGDPGTVEGDADGNGTVDSGDISYIIFRLGPC